MPPSGAPHRARHPADLPAILRDAVNGGDVDAYLDAHDADATVVVPPDGRTAHGRGEIRTAIVPLLAMQPRMTTAVTKVLEADGLALVHGRWTLALTDAGCRSELRGAGTTVSRRLGDGTWRIVLDDPLAGP
jgi:uncharacterized protein (TIGR02246 family)